MKAVTEEQIITVFDREVATFKQAMKEATELSPISRRMVDAVEVTIDTLVLGLKTRLLNAARNPPKYYTISDVESFCFNCLNDQFAIESNKSDIDRFNEWVKENLHKSQSKT